LSGGRSPGKWQDDLSAKQPAWPFFEQGLPPTWSRETGAGLPLVISLSSCFPEAWIFTSPGGRLFGTGNAFEALGLSLVAEGGGSGGERPTMRFRTEPATILVIDPDVVLGQVLSKVLARDGRRVVHAVNAAQALQLAEEHAPRLALLDCCLRDGNGLELAEDLHTRAAGLPLIFLAAHPLESEWPTRPSYCVRVLTKPLDLQELRRAVDVALEQGGTSGPVELPKLSPKSAQPLALAKELCMPVFLTKFFRVACMIVIAGAVLVGFAMAMGVVHVPWPAQAEGKSPPPPRPEAFGVELVRDKPHTLLVPEEVRKTLGIRKGNTDRIAVAKTPTRSQPLVMPGSTALDPTRLMRIRARFAPAEVVEIGRVPEDPRKSGKMETVFRELRSGDKVRKGDLLGILYSVDVGNKKNDLVDASYQLQLDEEILKRAEAAAQAVPEVFILNARRNVQGDKNAITRAVNTLKTWGIPEEDIQAVRDEAENVKKRQGQHDKDKEAQWARVELRAPDDGVIIERNVALHEMVVDNTTNLFQIAKVETLTVLANVPEDDLPALEALPSDLRRWTVKTVGSEPIAGFIDDIGYLIDPNQHTAVVKGHIENNDGKLRAGQFISATVELPPPPDVVEVPISAVVEDGKQCLIFVQAEETKPHYTMRRVHVTHRFERTAFVRCTPIPKEEQLTPEEEDQGLLPREPLKLGERVLEQGVLELKTTLLDLESQPDKKTP
jgi:cobalt-zinc-cadmium efflux system membrane fusion protein